MSVATRWRRRRPTSAVQFLDADRRGNVTCDPSPLGVPGGPASSLPLSLSHLAQQRFLLLIDVPLKNAKVVVVPSEVTELMTGAGAGGRDIQMRHFLASPSLPLSLEDR